MDWINIFNLLGLSGLFSTIILFLIKRYYNRKDKKEDELNNKVSEIAEIKKKIEEYDNTLQDVQSVIAVISDAQQAMLRDRIIQIYNHYGNEKKYFPLYARESVEHMYKSYKNLNAINSEEDGVVDDLVNTLENLPTELK